ncbi:hypothetical protein [Anaerocellum danielii]|uniref:Uncharacterized protein n=1 Tax=Anaerocellum danielii TaxID=1387557 RepID=A0ABZ0U655_9FIRM|nr:hypothetical protein [Caldicellulosiruptor danielii]WPX09230.1 hypothetical protein SOJ16_000424 [Caldicellulosiruptor danielii]
MTLEEYRIKKYLIESELYIDDPSEFKSSIKGFLFAFLISSELSFLPPMLIAKNLITRIIFWIANGLFVFFSVWAIYILSSLYKRQRQIVLYNGLLYLVWSLILLVGAVEYVGILLHLHILAFLFIAIYIAIFWLIFRVYIPKKLKGWRSKFYKTKLGKKILGIATAISSFAGVLGMTIAKMTKDYLSQEQVYFAMAMGCLALSYMTIKGSENIYRYYLMIKYPQCVSYYEPPKEKRKRTTKKSGKDEKGKAREDLGKIQSQRGVGSNEV